MTTRKTVAFYFIFVLYILLLSSFVFSFSVHPGCLLTILSPTVFNLLFNLSIYYFISMFIFYTWRVSICASSHHTPPHPTPPPKPAWSVLNSLVSSYIQYLISLHLLIYEQCQIILILAAFKALTLQLIVSVVLLLMITCFVVFDDFLNLYFILFGTWSLWILWDLGASALLQRWSLFTSPGCKCTTI